MGEWRNDGLKERKSMDKWNGMLCSWCVVGLLLFAGFKRIEGGGNGNVTYDGRSLIINGRHAILFSASIHYPRSTPDMWPSLIAKAKQGGVQVIQTYVFWNLHEPQQGQFDFTGRRDLVGFIKQIQAQGLHATLRIGPFIEAEWTHGGLPVWLRDIPNIVFRSDNEPFKNEMQKFTTKIVEMMKEENLYASQGGPIILSQIENEYTLVEPAFHEKGPPYVRWAANMSVGLQTGVPWVMCRQDDAPDPMINACNGMRCGETFAGPNSPNKPSIWTENWTSFYQLFGEEPYMRSPEDIAFQVALFIAKNGSYVNYYMYHGGTNFGRSGSPFVTTSYYDQAPLDEYGLIRQPKWGHLKELHAAVKLCSEALLSGTRTTVPLGKQQDAYEFRDESGNCAAFLVNNEHKNVNIRYQNEEYDLPKESISILPDCKTVAFNTAKVSTQHGRRSVTSSRKLDSEAAWQEFKEIIPSYEQTSIRANTLLEQINMTKDRSDFLWYTFRYHHDSLEGRRKLDVSSRSHALLAYVNGEFAGAGHGSHKERVFSLKQNIDLRNGGNDISLLSVMTGLPDGGAYLERRVAGLRRVRIAGEDLSHSLMGYQVGLVGEHSEVYKINGSSEVGWSPLGSSDRRPLTWYKTSFDAPAGNDPVAVNLGSMGKGEAWVNGESIGKYWVSFLTPKGNPSQTWYHIPRSFLKPSGNLLVLLEEEEKRNPFEVSIDTISITKVCAKVSESHYPTVSSWVSHHGHGPKPRHKHGRRPRVQLLCPPTKKISKILFASFGNPAGNCESYVAGDCQSPESRAVVEKACLGKAKCTVQVSARKFGGDPCPGTLKSLIVDAQCT